MHINNAYLLIRIIKINKLQWAFSWVKPCCSSERICIINKYAVNEYVLLCEYVLLWRFLTCDSSFMVVGMLGTLDSIRLVHYYVNHKCGLWDRYVYMHVMKSKNCVTKYFGLKDKILTLMDNLYSVLSFGKESCTIKWRLLYSYVCFRDNFVKYI